MAWIATDNDGDCYVYDERPQKCPSGYKRLSGRASFFDDSATAEILGIPFPEPGEMIEWPSTAQVAAPEPEPPQSEKKDCTSCRHFAKTKQCALGLEEGLECYGKGTFRSWIPIENTETGKKFDEGKLRYDFEKACNTCKWDHRICPQGPEKDAHCAPCYAYSNWEPIENTETGKKFDEGKLRYDLIPVEALREVVRVLTFGAKKYGDNNWKITKPESRYTAAAMRHGEAYRGGEIHDPEWGTHHLAHRICCDLFLLQINLEKETEK